MTPAAWTCPACSYPNTVRVQVCGLCGKLRAPGPAAVPSPAAVVTQKGGPLAPGPTFVAIGAGVPAGAAVAAAPAIPRIAGLTEPVFHLALGAVLAVVFMVTPILGRMGWFLAALFHETGHFAVAMLTGCPAVPTISLTMQGCTIHRPQVWSLALFMQGVVAWLAWKAWPLPLLRWPALVAAVLLPLIAWNESARDTAITLGGHLGELAFAGVALWRARTGGFTSSAAERTLYGCVGWYLVGRNALMCVGLICDAQQREDYAGSGSYGLTNDYIRAAEDYLNWQLSSVAGLMLVVALAVFPLSLLGGRGKSSR